MFKMCMNREARFAGLHSALELKRDEFDCAHQHQTRSRASTTAKGCGTRAGCATKSSSNAPACGCYGRATSNGIGTAGPETAHQAVERHRSLQTHVLGRLLPWTSRRSTAQSLEAAPRENNTVPVKPRPSGAGAWTSSSFSRRAEPDAEHPSTSMARSMSATLGKDGAMRILRSCGSFLSG